MKFPILLVSFGLVLSAAARADVQEFYDLEDDVAHHCYGSISDHWAHSGDLLANQLLEMAPQYENDWDYGNAIHHANLALGRSALLRGDTEGAIRFLGEAAKVKGSPQLDSFGPNMYLASELLEAGEVDAVLEYFDAVAVFWKGADAAQQIAEWKGDIANRRMPNFGGNLWY